MTTLGIRNNNPFNVEITNPPTPWQGRDPSQLHPAQMGVPKTQTNRFVRMLDPISGIRMGLRNLIYYQDHRGKRTIRDIVSTWAPANDSIMRNHTSAYISNVVAWSGFGPEEVLDLHQWDTLWKLGRAMVRQENGIDPYTDAQWTKAMVMAGIQPPEKPLAKTGTVKGGQVAGAGTTVVAGSEAVNGSDLGTLGQLLLPYVTWLGIALIVGGVGYMIWRRIDDRRKGLR